MELPDIPRHAPLPLISTADMRAAEWAVIAAGTDGYDLMQRAAEAVVGVVRARYGGLRRVLVLAGPGNNGGDGFVVARRLSDDGLDIAVATMVPLGALSGDAARAAADWHGRVLPLDDAAPFEHELIVDALFGIGLSRPVEGSPAAAVRTVNATGRPVVAIDIPSGIDSDTGAVQGIAVRASDTVTFHRLKAGHILQPGRRHAGRIVCADIGLAGPDTASVVRNDPALWRHRLAPPSTEAHKYHRGHVLVLAGGLESVGAARLSARGALRAGAGLVTIACPSDAVAAHAARGPDALMIRRCNGLDGLEALLDDARRRVVVAGPALGVGAATRARVARLAQSDRALVLDADALTSFADDPDALFAALAARPLGAATVLTPHDGEFTRLFGAATGGKLQATLAAAKRANAHIVYKGPDTVVAGPDGGARINTNGTALLATAGTGDVLAGQIGGLLARGLGPGDAAAAAVWLHAAAARHIGVGLIADDLPDALPRALARLAT